MRLAIILLAILFSLPGYFFGMAVVENVASVFPQFTWPTLLTVFVAGYAAIVAVIMFCLQILAVLITGDTLKKT